MQARTCSNNKLLKTVCKKTAKPRARGPSDKTRWAYWMQAIEPTNPAIEEAFPGYHPLWVQESQRIHVTPKSFHHLRRSCLNVTRSKVAAYLRVSVRTVQRWENGDAPIPFMAFEVLRLVFESTAHRLSHARWDGWYFDREGRLVSPDVGRLAVGPEDFTALVFLRGELDAHRQQSASLREEIAALEAENTRIRQMYRDQGVTRELEAMQDRLDGLLASIRTAQVIPFVTTAANLEKAA
ncbi:MAG: hypothetical protein FD187_1775 [bacterium]|nr:MAG: hypothetical protein FD142_724 [bacterium]KAF0148729.1 MAG: hypothetical protein FD187_1775 [bacterium]KAF0168219.1 MAG: hypothetical protein FD158_1612 [bacterium]TXT18740.1 MAG: hypothetical protein FD132_2014 [bacterium]